MTVQGTDGNGIDAGDVSVHITIVIVSTPVTTGPHEDAATPLAAISHALDEGSGGEVTWTIHCLAVIIRTP